MELKTLPVSAIILVDTFDDQLTEAIHSVEYCAETLLVTDQALLALFLRKKYTKPQIKVVVFDEKKPLDFSRLRNWATDQSSQDMVIHIDSDEVLRTDAKVQLSAALADCSPLKPFITIKRIDHYLDKKILFGEAGQTFIIRGGWKEKIIFKGAVHESVLSRTNQKSTLIVDHFPHTSLVSFFEKVSGYAKIRSQELEATANWILLLQLILYPPMKFFNQLILKQGWRDGWRGVVYAFLMSLHSFFVRVYALEKR